MTSPSLQFVIDLALEAGGRIEAAGKLAKKVQEKASASDLVTETDVSTERFCIDKIRAAFPTHMFHCEEIETGSLGSGPTWVIDPIDGTANFVHTCPDHCISIAYFQDKQPLIGVIYVPNRKELFTAEKGKGAYLNVHTPNPVKLSVAVERELSDSLITTGFLVGFLHKKFDTPEQIESQKKFRDVMLHNFANLIDRANDIRRTGSCAVDLCAVAAGRFDGYCEIGVHNYDYGAGILIVTEAGGALRDYNGEPAVVGTRHLIAASTDKLALELASILKRAPIPDDEF